MVCFVSIMRQALAHFAGWHRSESAVADNVPNASHPEKQQVAPSGKAGAQTGRQVYQQVKSLPAQGTPQAEFAAAA
jgi:hypothetical protein